MDAKHIEKEKARELRLQGLSLTDIVAQLGVSKSSVSVWIRDIPVPERFTEEYRCKIKTRRTEEKEQAKQLKIEKKTITIEKVKEHIDSVSKKGEATLVRLISGDGRWMISTPSNYKGKTYIGGRYVYEHRLIMENAVGRLLEFNDVVHHLNGNKLDNHIDNLALETRANHGRIHAKAPIIKTVLCAFCGNTFGRTQKQITLAKYQGHKHIFCCLSHAVSFQQRERWEAYRKKSNYPIEYVSDMPEGKTSEFSISEDGLGTIRVNTLRKNSFETFWRWHEEGHVDFWKELLLKHGGNVPEALKTLQTKIRVDYPENEEEIYAFKRQFEALQKQGITKKDILMKLEEEYNSCSSYSAEKIVFFEKLLGV